MGELGGFVTLRSPTDSENLIDLATKDVFIIREFCSASAELERADCQRRLEAPPAPGCSHFSLAASVDRSRGKQSAEARHAYTWPSSWAMVNAVLSPLSSMMLQLLYGSHTVPNSARPSPKKKKKGKKNPSVVHTVTGITC